MRTHGIGRGPFGVLLQAGMPKVHNTKKRLPSDCRGLTVRGVVVAVYLYDAENGHLQTGSVADNAAMYCDVMLYGGYAGKLPRVLVTTTRGGLHEDDIDPPRPTNIDVTGTLDPDHGSNPVNWDGDHVLVGFLEGEPNQPYIAARIPHPRSDVGVEDLQIGHRLRPKTGESPAFRKHRGSFFGLDSNGNFVADLSRAHDGAYSKTGVEPAPDGSGADFYFNGADATIDADTVEIARGADNHVVRGEDYNSAHEEMLSSIATALAGIANSLQLIETAVEALGLSMTPPKVANPSSMDGTEIALGRMKAGVIATAGLTSGVAGGLIGSALTSVGTFSSTGAPGALSQNVKVK